LENVTKEGFYKFRPGSFLPDGGMLSFVNLSQLQPHHAMKKSIVCTINDIDTRTLQLHAADYSERIMQGRLTITVNGSDHQIGLNKNQIRRISASPVLEMTT
jgi:hypothetical protein